MCCVLSLHLRMNQASNSISMIKNQSTTGKPKTIIMFQLKNELFRYTGIVKFNCCSNCRCGTLMTELWRTWITESDQCNLFPYWRLQFEWMNLWVPLTIWTIFKIYIKITHSCFSKTRRFISSVELMKLELITSKKKLSSFVSTTPVCPNWGIGIPSRSVNTLKILARGLSMLRTSSVSVIRRPRKLQKMKYRAQ